GRGAARADAGGAASAGGLVSRSERGFQERLGRIEALLRQVEGCADASAREAAREVVQTVLELHGAALAAMLELAGPSLVDAFCRDDLVASLLLLHGLHPLDLAARARAALDQVRTAGVVADLLGVPDGVVRVRLTAGPRAAVEEALAAAAPDAAGVQI